MADSTYRVGVLLDLAAGRYRSGAKAAAKDTDRLGGIMRKTAGAGSLMGRRVTEGARGARREVRRTAEESDRLGRALRGTGRDGERSLGRLTGAARRYRTEMSLAARAAGRLRGGLLGVAGVAGLGFGGVAAFRNVLTLEQRYARLEIQAGATAKQMDMVRKVVHNTASAPNIRLDRSNVLAGIEAYVERTGDLAAALNSIVPLSQAIQGFGGGGPGAGAAFGGILAELRKLGIVNEREVRQALNLFAAQGKQGAFPVGALATEAPAVLSAASALGYRGIEGAREVGALLQSAQATIANPAEAATATEALLRTFSDLQKIEAIWTEFGVNVQDASGRTRPLSTIIRDLLQATGGDPVELSRGGIFDQTAIRAMPRTMEAFAWHEGIRTIEVPPTLIADASARMAETTGAKIQETKTDTEDWIYERLGGPVGEVVTALTSFKDELLVGVGLLAGSWYAFKALRAAGGLMWRLAGRGGASPGRPPPGPLSPGGSAGGSVRGSFGSRASERGGSVRGSFGSRASGLVGSVRGSFGSRASGLGGSVRGAFGSSASERGGSVRGSFGSRASGLGGSVRGSFGSRASGLGGSVRGAFGSRASERGGSVRGSFGSRASERGGSVRGSFGSRASGLVGPTTRPRNNAWGDSRRQAALMRSREEAARRSPSLMRELSGRSGPTTRPRNAPATLRPRWAGGLWRSLTRGLGPASAGAMMGLTAHDIATGAIPPEQIPAETGGLTGGLGGSWLSALLTAKLTRAMPGPVRFAAPLMAGLGGWMGGESVGRAAAKAVFDPGYVDPGAASAADKFFRRLPQPGEGEGLWPWLQDVFGGDDAPEIGNWRGIGVRRRNRGRRDVGRNPPEVWTPPPGLLEPATPDPRRGRLGIGQRPVNVTYHNTQNITVHSNASDPQEVAEEVADEIERRQRMGRIGLRDALLADPTPEATY